MLTWPKSGETSFTIRHADTYGETQDSLFAYPDSNGDALAHLWRHIDPPYVTDTATVGGDSPRISWQNRHLGRYVDSTEVYRKVAGGEWLHRATLAFTADQFTDTALARGVYAYFVRHVTAHAFRHLDVSTNIPPPHSSSSDSRTFYVDTSPPTPPSSPAAPLGLWCEGNFAPEMDCFWFNGDTTASTEIRRNSVLKATLYPRETHYLDLTVTRGSTYTYAIRHVKNGLASDSVWMTTTADPVPPGNLTCAGTSTSTAGCVWEATEPYDTVQLQRRTTKTWQVVAIVPPPVPPEQAGQFNDSGLQTGVTYTYRARYRKGTDYSAFSNEDAARPDSIPEPFRPQP